MLKKIKTNIIYNEDCIEGMKRLPDKSANLIIADPPYNIGKTDWDKIPNYIDWLGNCLLEMQRVLKDKGSFYLFHNDFLQMVEIQNWINKNSKFVFKQLIVWNKRFEGYWNQLNAIVESKENRNYSKQAEYILFYTFQDDTGLTTIFNNPDCFRSLKEYFYNEKKRGNFTNNDINKILGTATNGSGMAGHYFKKDLIQWTLPTKGMYQKLQVTGFFQKPYEDLHREREDLRRKYEGLRYIFNNQKTHHSVWNYKIAKKNGHLTPKPILLIENILKHSSNKDDIVLIPFVGSGNECIACKKLDRYYIGFETNLDYCRIAEQRLEAEKTLWDIKKE